jgi:drug/metabolite transporter superfamily protein YnfA
MPTDLVVLVTSVIAAIAEVYGAYRLRDLLRAARGIVWTGFAAVCAYISLSSNIISVTGELSMEYVRMLIMLMAVSDIARIYIEVRMLKR